MCQPMMKMMKTLLISDFFLSPEKEKKPYIEFVKHSLYQRLT